MTTSWRKWLPTKEDPKKENSLTTWKELGSGMLDGCPIHRRLLGSLEVPSSWSPGMSSSTEAGMEQKEFPHNHFPLWPNCGSSLSSLTPVPGWGGGTGVRVTLLLPSVGAHSHGKKLPQAGPLVPGTITMWVSSSQLLRNIAGPGAAATGKTGWPKPRAWNLKLRPMVLMSPQCGANGGKLRRTETKRDKRVKGQVPGQGLRAHL